MKLTKFSKAVSEKLDNSKLYNIEEAFNMLMNFKREAFTESVDVAFNLGVETGLISRTAEVIEGCYRAFSELDATMVEVNPLVITKDKHVLALDCKMSFDNNALFRRNDVSELRDKSQENPSEVYASDRGLNYVGLEGNIGNIINGAGLAMASMDMIKSAGGEPANFLDIGGGATPEKIVKAFKLVSSDEKVKVILVNIFAGINRCDWVAEGIVQALQKIEIKVPLVIRLAGTNVEKGNQILKESKINYIEANTLEDAANKAVKALGKQMSVLIDKSTKILIQGFTGKMGTFHADEMIKYGSKVVGGVTPGKGGSKHLNLPVFNTVKEAVETTGASASILFVPPAFAADSAMEAADAGIKTCVAIVDGIPSHDMIRIKRYMRRYSRVQKMTLIGPNCAGVISPGKCMLGIMPGHIYKEGNVGVIGRSGTLGYEAAQQMKDLDIGISTSVGIGGDPINGSAFKDHLAKFEKDDETKVILMIGEIGGPQEAEAAEYAQSHCSMVERKRQHFRHKIVLEQYCIHMIMNHLNLALLLEHLIQKNFASQQVI